MRITRLLSLSSLFVAILAAALCVDGRLHAQMARIDGTSVMSGAAPNVTSCGSGAVVAGTDHAGIITVGSGVITACTLNFSATLAVTPACVATTSLATVVVALTPSASSVAAALSLTLGGGKIYYLCAF